MRVGADSARLPAIVAGACESDHMSATAEFALLAAEDCPLCGQAGSMIVPDFCTDDHEGDCSERMCVTCGSALFVDPAAGPALRSA